MQNFPMTNFHHILLKATSCLSSFHRFNKYPIPMINSNPRWKIILHAETQSRHIFLNTYKEYISTNELINLLLGQNELLETNTITLIKGLWVHFLSFLFLHKNKTLNELFCNLLLNSPKDVFKHHILNFDHCSIFMNFQKVCKFVFHFEK